MEKFRFELTLREQISLRRLQQASALATPGAFLTHAVAVLDTVLLEARMDRQPYVFGQDGLYESIYKIDLDEPVDRLTVEFAKRNSPLEFNSGRVFAQQLGRIAAYFAETYQTPRSRNTAAALALEFAVCVDHQINHSNLEGGYLACVRTDDTRGTILRLPYDQRPMSGFARVARRLKQAVQRKMAPTLGVR